MNLEHLTELNCLLMFKFSPPKKSCSICLFTFFHRYKTSEKVLLKTMLHRHKRTTLSCSQISHNLHFFQLYFNLNSSFNLEWNWHLGVFFYIFLIILFSFSFFFLLIKLQSGLQILLYFKVKRRKCLFVILEKYLTG